MTRLIALYWDTNPTRMAEINHALWQNVQNPDIDEVVLLISEGTQSRLPESPKIRYIELPTQRPTYKEIFDTANSLLTSPHDRTVLINSDCYFEVGDLAKLQGADWRQFMFVVTRRDVGSDGNDLWYTGQDAWIFTGRIRPMKWLNFTPGSPKCDWYLAWLARHAGYLIANLEGDMTLWHLHKSEIRTLNPTVSPPLHLQVGEIREVKPSRLASIPHPQNVRTGVIAYSLYGSEAIYLHGACINAEMVRHIYAGFIPRFYIDETVPRDIVARLVELHCEIVWMPRHEGHEGALWRLKALEDPSVDFVCIRDVDSRLSYRDRTMFEQWVQSGFDYHAVRDHPWHKNPVILSHFNSRKPFTLPTKEGLSKSYNQDEWYFANRVLPLLGDSVAYHDTFCSSAPLQGAKLFSHPISEDWFYYVGAKVWPDEGIDPATLAPIFPNTNTNQNAT